MGAWGAYDNDNDHVFDAWIDIIRMFMPREFVAAMNVIVGIDYDSYATIIEKYASNNKEKVYAACGKWIKNFLKEYGNQVNNAEQYIVGVIIEAMTKSNEKSKKSSSIPHKLDKDCPKSLVDLAIKSIRQMIDTIDCNKEKWRDVEERKLSLQHELFLFTAGKEGISPSIKKRIIPKKKYIDDNFCSQLRPGYAKSNYNLVASSKKASKKSSKKTSKKSSKKSSKKYLSRPSPPVSAQNHPGKIKKGNDGSKWMSRQNVNGVYQWKKI